MLLPLQRRRFDKKIQDLENDLTVSGERSRHVISEVAGKDEELVVMKVENVTLQERVKTRTEEVSKQPRRSSTIAFILLLCLFKQRCNCFA
jgi:hypothetical protein